MASLSTSGSIHAARTVSMLRVSCLLAAAGAKEKVYKARPFRPLRLPVHDTSDTCDKADPFPREGSRCYDRHECMLELEKRGQAKQDTGRLAALFRNTSMLVLGDSVNLYRAQRLEREGVKRNCGEGLARADAEAKGKGVCYSPHNRVMDTWCTSSEKRARLSQRRDFDVVFWNYGGLHRLHLLPARPSSVPGRHGPVTIGRLTTSQEYKAGLEQCAKVVSDRYPTAKLVYVLTNDVCAQNFAGPYAAAARRWSTKRDDPLYDMQMTSVGVRTLRTHERAVARAAGHTVLDPQNDGLCACTARGDGRHYVDTDPRTLGRLADLVVSYRFKPDGRIVFTS